MCFHYQKESFRSDILLFFLRVLSVFIIFVIDNNQTNKKQQIN